MAAPAGLRGLQTPTLAGHLVRRWAGSLARGGPSSTDETWVASVLGPGETALWERMDGSDRRHAVAVARRVEHALAAPSGAVLAAALLHDVGKVEAGLGTPGRVVATLVGLAGGRRCAGAWAARSGRLGQLGRYLGYPRLGAGLLEAAGSDPLVVAWAAQHHLAPERCQLPRPLAAVLRAADRA